MTTSEETADKEWRALADLELEEMEARMLKVLTELETLPDEKRLERRLAMARVEHDLSEKQLRAVTLCRLRTWLKLEPEVAKRTAASFETVMKKISGTQAMREIALVQTLAREFSPEDQQILVGLAPSVFGGAPIGLKVVKSEPSPRVKKPVRPAKKWWWPFG